MTDCARLRNCRCVVTGAAQGIGAGIAARLAGEGAVVLAVDRPGAVFDFPRGAALERIIPFEQDITDADAAANLIRAARDTLGGLDILVNNAGVVAPPQAFEQISAETLRWTLEVNLVAMHCLCAAAVPLLRASERARIINIGSLNSLVPTAGVAPYVASKHAVLGLTRNIAVELGAQGITANCVLPGAIVTPMSDELAAQVENYDASMKARTPLGRRGQPDDIAGAVVFLASADASFITGHGLVVDGGIGLGA